MKTIQHPGQKRARTGRRAAGGGFTLIELMVVIGIIIVLGGLLFPAISAIKNQANKGKAAAAISNLCVASNAYYNDYGKWPDLDSSSELVMVFNGGISPLTGTEDSAAKQDNPRKIRYMEFKLKEVIAGSGSGDAGGGGEVRFYDPWGITYAFCYDNGRNGVAEGCSWKDNTAYDNVIQKPFEDGLPGGTINAGCAFFSNGPDQRTGTDPSDPKNQSSQAKAFEDDIRSWK